MIGEEDIRVLPIICKDTLLFVMPQIVIKQLLHSWVHVGMVTLCVPPDYPNVLYEHHCYRKYSDNLDESAEGFFWEEFYQTNSEQGSDSYYR